MAARSTSPGTRSTPLGTRSSSALSATLPVRSVSAASTFTTRDINDCIRDAVSVGTEISGLIGDTLRQSPFANNEESNLHQILTLAEELHTYQSPVEFTIGFIGDTGVGKSSLINSLLDENNLAKTAGNGEACTTVVTEYRKRREIDIAAYSVEIRCMNDTEIEEFLRQIVVDYRRYHLRPDSIDAQEEERLRRRAKVGWDNLIAVFADRDECTEAYFMNPNVGTEELHRLVSRWREEFEWPEGFDLQGSTFSAVDAAECVHRIELFLRARVWPFIKVIRIYLDKPILQSGVVLVDLPGLHDVNSTRISITEARLYECDEIFVVTSIGRAAANASVESLIIRQVGTNFSELRRSQGVAIICTKSEDLGQESEILRDVPNTDEFNVTILQEMRDEIQDAEDEGKPVMHLIAKRDNLFISARNQHVKSQLNRHYAAQANVRRIKVFCVSSKCYRKASEKFARIEKSMQRHRRSSNMLEMTSAANQLLSSSGITELREFCQGIPIDSQIAETRHFLNTRIIDLFEKSDLWLNASVAGIGTNREAAPEALNEFQLELKHSLGASVAASNEGMTEAKVQTLQRPFTIGINRWEQAAVAAMTNLGGKHPAVLATFWNHAGAHTTTTEGYKDWNAEIIRAMVTDFQPAEDSVHSWSKRVFESLVESTSEALSTFLENLRDLQGLEDIRTTFPRRRRHLEYDVNNVAVFFLEEVQTIFHELCTSNRTSYVMRHMLPMYDEIIIGTGMRKRMVKRIQFQIEGDRQNPKLFRVLRDTFISAMDTLLGTVDGKLRAVTEQCCEDIRNDLELLRGEDNPAPEQASVLEMMFETLDQAKQRRDAAQCSFEAGLPGTVAARRRESLVPR